MPNIQTTLLVSICTVLLVACGGDSSSGGAAEVAEDSSTSSDTNTSEGEGEEENGTSTDTSNGEGDGADENNIPADTISNSGDSEGAVDENIVVIDPNRTQRLTFNDNQQELNADVSTSSVFAITNDSRYLLFSTAATNVLETGDSEDTVIDVYLRDTLAGSITKVSKAIDGRSNDNRSLGQDISDDGRYSVFTSGSTALNLDANGSTQIYLYDALSQSNTIISRTPSGDVGTGNSTNPLITANGDTVIFNSRAQNLRNEFSSRATSTFIYDVGIGTITELLPESQVTNIANNMATYPFVTTIDISADGRFVLFETRSNNDTVYFVVDRTSGDLTKLPEGITSSATFGMKISDTGRYVVGRNGDSTERPIVWIDLQQNIKIEFGLDTLVPNWAGPDFSQIASPEEISADGQTILYYGVLHDGPLPATSDNSYWNVYALDISELEAVLVSRGIDQSSGNRPSNFPRFANNKQSIVYHSDASNLVEDDTNFRGDIFSTPLQSE